MKKDKEKVGNVETSRFDERTPGKGIASEKNEATGESVKSSQTKLTFQKELSTPENVYEHQDNLRRDHSQDLEPENTMPSLTVPDDTLTLAEIMHRYATGKPLGARNGYYELFEESEFEDAMPDLRGMDLAEIQQRKADADARVKELESELQSHADRKNEKAIQALAEKKYQELLKSRFGRDLLARREKEMEDEAENPPNK